MDSRESVCPRPLKRPRRNRFQSQLALNSYAGTAAARAARTASVKLATPRPKKNPAAVIGEKLPDAPLKLAEQDDCPYCAAKRFEFEPPHFCCGQGTIKLAANEYPPELVRLYTSDDEDAVHFRKYARLYNNLFAFSSLGGEIEAGSHKGIYVFKLQGQIYHHVPDLLPSAGKPKYLQLYFYDGQHEAQNRTDCFAELRQDVVDILIKVTERNPYAQFFRSLQEINVAENTQILINKTSVPDQRTYNCPTSDEVAVIWTESSSSSQSDSPHITVSGRSHDSHRIMHYYGCYDPLQYPLMFPSGDCGWHQGILKKTKNIKNVPKNTQASETQSEVVTEESLLCDELLDDYSADIATQTSETQSEVVTEESLLCDELLDDYSADIATQTSETQSEIVTEENLLCDEVLENYSVNVDVDHATSAEQLLAAEAICANTKPKKGVKHVSCREYYSYKLQNRPNNMLLRAGRCLQQYIVDMYVKVENTRLDFYRQNQDTIRADLYQGLLDTVQAGESCAANAGKRVILPPTFLGGPRDMKRRYLNAMALVQKFGKPDLFITMTCNANWPEIKNELKNGEVAQNRPDLVSRVFQAKLLALKKLIMKKRIFGDVAAMIYVVEFQKRGLPHAHFLICLKPTFKVKCPADFDKYVCAEIPSIENSYLRSIVLRHMMHGPCGDLNLDCPCMKHTRAPGRCKDGFPKKFVNDTTNSQDGYPLYKRRDTGQAARVRGCTLNNQWVVPYNPYLLALFDCHLNVEVCSTIQAVKYLYKYVYKGHDKVSFKVAQKTPTDVINEIDQYQSGRWVSPCEAAWRIFGFDLFEMYPSVMPLPIHLEKMQPMQVRPHENLVDVLADDKRVRTPLTEYFKINAETGGTGILYSNFPEYYRWDTTKKRWFKRKTKVIVIGRLTFVAPAEGERYFLRLLLLHVRNAVSFNDLMTVEGCRCASFQDAAIKLRLLEEDNTVEQCLQEAAAVQMPIALRRLFATVLIFSHPSNPGSLWTAFYSDLSADFRCRYPHNPSKVLQLTVTSLEHYLEAMGKSLIDFGLQHLTECQSDEIRHIRDITDALEAPIPEDCSSCRHLLNPGQQAAFNSIVDHAKRGIPGAFFIDGPGGTGKTFLYKALYAELRLMGKIVLPTATSGIAASNIPSGRTAHSRFKIPVDVDGSQACSVPKQGSLAALIKETSLIIWDEASMARRENVESLDLLLRDLCDPNALFGGKLIVFGGDFRQVLPVLPRRSIREAVEVSLVNSHLWPKFTKFRLIENVRAREDPEFSEFLLALGNGELQDSETAFIQLPQQIVHSTQDVSDPITAIATATFPEMASSNMDADTFTTRAILTPMNDEVDSINTVLIEKFPGETILYKSFDTVLDDNCNVYPTEFINKLCPGGMSPHELVLKLDCPVILLRNLMPSGGLCNGTRLLCKRFMRNAIECIIMVGHHKGEHVFIPRIKLRPTGSADFPVQFQRVQFPIKLSFAMTINKAQGQTLDKVAVYLPKPCFSPGQLYVALSRAKKSTQVDVISTSDNAGINHGVVQNIVSYDVLRQAGIIV